MFVGVMTGTSVDGLDKTEILNRREKVFGPSLSLSYEQPLTMIRGKGPYLFNEGGQAYLDCVNNVAHVGHSHPRVVSATKHQAMVLNTNTRYLNPVTVSYAERLCSLFPSPLDTLSLIHI